MDQDAASFRDFASLIVSVVEYLRRKAKMNSLEALPVPRGTLEAKTLWHHPVADAEEEPRSHVCPPPKLVTDFDCVTDGVALHWFLSATPARDVSTTLRE
jgi:hypothetical protein